MTLHLYQSLNMGDDLMIGLLQLVDDPIFIPISQLEQSRESRQMEADMKAGRKGHLRIEEGRKVKGRVSLK